MKREAFSTYYASSGLLHGCLSSVMGTQLDALILGRTKEELQLIWEAIGKEVERLDRMLNRFDPESEVSLLNRTAGQRPVFLQEELWSILWDCKKYYERTFGLFDITLGKFSQLVFEEKEHSLFFADKEIQLDLGGYGKGYALFRFHALLLENQIRHALINFGNSSVLAVGTHVYGDCWPVGISDPVSQKTLGTVRLKDNSLSVSGNSPWNPAHIKNPHTGVYYEGRNLVSVCAPSAVDAEVLSTALLIADKEQCASLLSAFHIDDYTIYNL